MPIAGSGIVPDDRMRDRRLRYGFWIIIDQHGAVTVDDRRIYGSSCEKYGYRGADRCRSGQHDRALSNGEFG